MIRLDAMLEPGEQVLLRVRMFPLWYHALMMIAGLVLALNAAWRLAVGSGDIISEIAIAALGCVMLVGQLVIIGKSSNRALLVTDRRLIEGMGRGHYEETPLTEIDAVTPYRLGDGLFVTGGGRKIVIPCKEKTAERIFAAIQAAAAGVV